MASIANLGRERVTTVRELYLTANEVLRGLHICNRFILEASLGSQIPYDVFMERAISNLNAVIELAKVQTANDTKYCDGKVGQRDDGA